MSSVAETLLNNSINLDYSNPPYSDISDEISSVSTVIINNEQIYETETVQNVSDNIHFDLSTLYDSFSSLDQDVNSMHDFNSSPLLAQDNLINLGLRGRGMHIGHLNVRGIRSGEKIDQIKIMLQSSENNICMLGISESKLGCDIPDSFLQSDNFHCFRKDKIQGSGGLLVYVRNDVTCNRRKDLEDEHFESMWFEIFPKNSRSFLVGHFYRNPLSTIAWNEMFDDQIEKVIQEEKELFILGDINRDLLNPQIKRQWLDYMNSHGLIQHVREPTRVVPDASKTLIDHIYSNFSDNIQYTDVPRIGLSDHYPVFLTRKVNTQLPKMTHHTIKYRSFKQFDETKFNDDLKSVPWDVIKVFDNVDDALDTWYSLLSDVIDKHVPLKQHRVKRINQPVWLNSEIIESIKTRDRFKALGNTEQYRIWRNKVVNLIKK